MAEIHYVVFDVGGVLVELTGGAKFIEWTGTKFETEQALLNAWLHSPSVQQFERGHCSSEDFTASIVKEFELPVSEETFLDEFERMPNGLLEGAKSLLEQVKNHRPIACLSNTNELHWSNQKDAGYLNDVFDQMFLSYQMGMVKPDQEIYLSMIRKIGLPPHHILFLDDNKTNVDAANRAGLTACLTKGIVEARSTLEKFNCLT